jgi:hypothetical protein
MLSRRETLRGGSAAVVGIAVSGTVAARVAVEDPVIALRNERERLDNWMNSLPSLNYSRRGLNLAVSVD